MATTFTFFGLPTIRASGSSSKMPEPNTRKPVSSSKWWTSLFGISSDPDYIKSTKAALDVNPRREWKYNSESKTDRPWSKLAIGCFTEEKAKQLRKMTMETSAFHDVMYHSAIAARLASDVTGKPDK